VRFLVDEVTVAVGLTETGHDAVHAGDPDLLGAARSFDVPADQTRQRTVDGEAEVGMSGKRQR
jgi:hypothetical protein